MRWGMLLLVAALAACGESRGWRGNMTGDWRQVALCAADDLAPVQPVRPVLRDDTRIAILAPPPAAGRAYEARLQETAHRRFFAEIREGSDSPAGRAAWAAIQACADGGPDRIRPPDNGRFDPSALDPSRES